MSAPFPDLLLNHFQGLASLSESERGVLRAMEPRPTRLYRAGEKLLTEGHAARAPHILAGGWAAHVRGLPDGRRQIFALVLPGDVVGLARTPDALAPATITAITDVRMIEAAEFAKAWDDRSRAPGLATVLNRVPAQAEFFFLSQIMRLGRQTAHERMANLLLELDYRLSQRGLSQDHGFAFPLTQETVADALGLSVVHVNRVLQQMRRDGHIELSRGRVTLRDMGALMQAGQFYPPPVKPRDAPQTV